MSLRKKLLASFGVMVALILVISGGAIFATADLNAELDRAANVTARRQRLNGDLSITAAQMASVERAAMLAMIVGDKPHVSSYLQQFQEANDRLRKSLA